MRSKPERRGHLALPLLLLLTVALAAACSQPAADPARPDGVVRLYLEALKASDVPAAYGYLTPELQQKCNESTLVERMPEFRQQLDASSVIVRRVNVNGSLATVETTINTGGRDVGLLGPRNGNGWDSTYQLKQVDGGWRLSTFAWPVHWCEEPRLLQTVVPVKP